ncbi:MAG TPA: GAF domain-containing protein [Candidatus Tectomicrobia bacterium]
MGRGGQGQAPGAHIPRAAGHPGQRRAALASRGGDHHARCRNGHEKSVVVGDVRRDERFASDPYVASARPRSILCVPIVQHGKRGGMLYLESNLAPEAFTAGRIEVLRLLAARAAISLENARLDEDMKQEVMERRWAEEELHRALAEVETLKNRLQAEKSTSKKRFTRSTTLRR